MKWRASTSASSKPDGKFFLMFLQSARILRGLRLAARLNFSFSKEADSAIRKHSSSILNLAKVTCRKLSHAPIYLLWCRAILIWFSFWGVARSLCIFVLRGLQKVGSNRFKSTFLTDLISSFLIWKDFLSSGFYRKEILSTVFFHSGILKHVYNLCTIFCWNKHIAFLV